jgi:YgiT-type zinc finger domain-containing protein
MRRSRPEPCDFCDGTLEARTVTVDWRGGGRLVVIENVPALVCDRCGERYFSQKAMRQMERIGKTKRSAKRTIRVPIARFQTVA